MIDGIIPCLNTELFRLLSCYTQRRFDGHSVDKIKLWVEFGISRATYYREKKGCK